MSLGMVVMLYAVMNGIIWSFVTIACGHDIFSSSIALRQSASFWSQEMLFTFSIVAYFSAIAFTFGIALRHGPHHEAQQSKSVSPSLLVSCCRVFTSPSAIVTASLPHAPPRAYFLPYSRFCFMMARRRVSALPATCLAIASNSSTVYLYSECNFLLMSNAEMA